MQPIAKLIGIWERVMFIENPRRPQQNRNTLAPRGLTQVWSSFARNYFHINCHVGSGEKMQKGMIPSKVCFHIELPHGKL